MAFLDEIPEHADATPITLDYTVIKDGLKWKTILEAEKEAFRQRIGSAEPITDEVYIFTCLIDYFKEFKRKQSIQILMDAKRAEIKQGQAALEAQIDEIGLEFNG